MDEFTCQSSHRSYQDGRLRNILQVFIFVFACVLMTTFVIWAYVLIRGSRGALNYWFGMRRGDGAIYYQKANAMDMNEYIWRRNSNHLPIIQLYMDYRDRCIISLNMIAISIQHLQAFCARCLSFKLFSFKIFLKN